jgi:hypothetical protein
MAELLQLRVNTINHHLKEIYSECELLAEATIRRYLIVQTEGMRQIAHGVTGMIVTHRGTPIL